ncbi:hypothetical protein [Tsukamurella paurometabola]|uniref:hypothetical protein n=1 Tax=Tsukamurella paurometabola TaxID=2061 RepID=UPI0011C082D6|nr:hypothetical protein [Tsukamurella paurometabola]
MSKIQGQGPSPGDVVTATGVSPSFTTNVPSLRSPVSIRARRPGYAALSRAAAAASASRSTGPLVTTP